jgi:hypothetical protein
MFAVVEIPRSIDKAELFTQVSQLKMMKMTSDEGRCYQYCQYFSSVAKLSAMKRLCVTNSRSMAEVEGMGILFDCCEIISSDLFPKP